jgi:hypothetical protein
LFASGNENQWLTRSRVLAGSLLDAATGYQSAVSVLSLFSSLVKYHDYLSSIIALRSGG